MVKTDWNRGVNILHNKLQENVTAWKHGVSLSRCMLSKLIVIIISVAAEVTYLLFPMQQWQYRRQGKWG